MDGQRAAIYARYSTTNQRETSLEDQLRRCRDIASRHGYVVADENVFTDAAVSGTDIKAGKRSGYKALIKAWEEGRFKALIVDDHSRLSRGPVQQANLYELIRRTGVRLITGNGLDSAQPTWPLIYGVYGAVAQQTLRDLQHMVTRGMLGQLARGYMIADAPFGYRRVLEQGPNGTVAGTKWEIDENEARYVREMYRMRQSGNSFSAIARWLNEQGVPPPRKARDGSRGHWRQSSLHRMMQNRIYSGVFVWQGSAFLRAKARKERRKLEPIAFERPELRLVDEHTFQVCASNGAGPSLRGNRKHIFAGLLRCGSCNSTLTVRRSSARRDGRASSGPCPGDTTAYAARPQEPETSTSLYCASCQHEVAVGVRQRFHGYVSTNAVREALLAVHGVIFDASVLRALRRRIQAKLDAPQATQVQTLKATLAAVTRTRERLVRLIASLPDHDDELLEREHRRAFNEECALREKLRSAEGAVTAAQAGSHALAGLLQADAAEACRKLLSKPAADTETRTALGRLFPRIRLVSRPERYVALFEVEADVSAACASADVSRNLESFFLKCKVEVRSSAHRPVKWSVRVLNIDLPVESESATCQAADAATSAAAAAA